MRIRLADADRELYGGPEWLDWDPNLLRESEAELFQQIFGDDPMKYYDWLEKSGTKAIKWAAWLALRRAGTEVAWATFDPNVIGLRTMRSESEEPAPEGKAPRRSTRPRRSAASGKS